MEEKGRRGTRTRPRERVLAPAAAAFFCAAAGTAIALLVPVAPRVSNGNAEKAQESSASATLLSPESLGVGASVPASKKRGGGEKAALPVPAGSVPAGFRKFIVPTETAAAPASVLPKKLLLSIRSAYLPVPGTGTVYLDISILPISSFSGI